MRSNGGPRYLQFRLKSERIGSFFPKVKQAVADVDGMKIVSGDSYIAEPDCKEVKQRTHTPGFMGQLNAGDSNTSEVTGHETNSMH